MISVLMLTYNREELVSRAIESVLAQTFQDFEFVIVDNGSTDKSGGIADSYAEKDRRVRVIHRPRGNIGAGRNTALDAARGEYLTFIDDDDWVEPDFLEFLIGLLEENAADVAICGTSGKAFDEKKIMTAEDALVELMWRKKFNTGFPTKIFQKKRFHTVRFEESDQFDDIGTMYKLLGDSTTIAYHGVPKYNVCRHESNNSAWTTNYYLLNAQILDEYLKIYQVRTKWLAEKFPQRIPTWQYFKWSFMISMVEKIIRLEIPGCSQQLMIMEKELRMHREEFLNASEILDFERKWVEQYVHS